MNTLMQCGHAAQAHQIINGGTERIPYCVICDCSIPMEEEKVPSLSGRRARCFYYGSRITNQWRNETHYPDLTKDTCLSETDSDCKLPFFESKPNCRFDEFYCGCHSWD